MKNTANRNIELNQKLESNAPKRSVFNLTETVKTSFMTGDYVPVYHREVVPGDTFEIDIAAVLRGSTLKFPVMSAAIIYFHAFYVPHRLVWDGWKQFLGENKVSHWYDKALKLQIPRVKIIPNGYGHNHLGAYLGVPIGMGGGQMINHLPIRAAVQIFNEYFRDQNYDNPLVERLDTGDIQPPADLTKITKLEKPIYGLEVPKVNKIRDLFTTALPQPQKGDDVLLDLAEYKIKFNEASRGLFGDFKLYSKDKKPFDDTGGRGLLTDIKQPGDFDFERGVINSRGRKLQISPKSLEGLFELEGTNKNLSIVQLRKLFAKQRFLEIDAISGTRYAEIILSHYGVNIGDLRANVPEYLGGFKEYINTQQVSQTSGTTSTSPQATNTAFSLTHIKRNLLDKPRSFAEHGSIVITACVKTEQSYQYALPRKWSIRDRLDLYFPEFDFIGEVPIKQKELYFANNDADNEKVIGYQKAYYEHKYAQNKISGIFHSNYKQPLDAWHYAEKHNQKFTITSDFLKQSDKSVQRTLAVQSQHQWLIDICFSVKAVRPMSINSSPRLIG